jgi:hypothetical protein
VALIGSIAINMVADAKQFNAGLAKATVGLRAFGRIGEMVGAQNPLLTMAQGAFMFGKSIGGLVSSEHKLTASVNGIVGGLGLMGGAILKVVTGGISLLVDALSGIVSIIGSVISGVLDLAKNIVMMGAAAGIAAGILAYKLVTAAMALGEQTDRARVVFGDFAKDVISEADKMATAYGVAKTSFISAATAFAAIFKGVGYTQEQSAKLSVHFVKLATDLSSLTHIPVEDALQKIQSGLAGQARPLREVGVFMSEDAVAAKAAALGIAKLGQELTEAQKIQARAAFITDSLKDAQGNLALTAGSAANQTRGLQGRIQNLMAEIGTSLLPIFASALSGLQEGVEAIKIAWEGTAIGARSATSGVVGGAEKQVEAISWIQKAVAKLADVWDAIKIKIPEVMGNVFSIMMKGMMRIEEILAQIAPFVGIASKDVQKALDPTIAALGQLSREQKNLAAERAKAAAAHPTREVTDSFFEQAREKIKAARDELAKEEQLNVGGMTPGNAAEGKTKGENKFADAMAAGSKEAANTILRSQFGSGGTGDPQKKTAENTSQIAASTKALVDLAMRGGWAVGQQLAGALGI